MSHIACAPTFVMSMSRRLRLAIVLALVLACGPGAAVAAAATTSFRGSFRCSDGQPLEGVRVELWQHEFTSLPKLPPNATQRNATTTDAAGGWGFRVSGRETNWFLRVVLSSEDAEVRDWLWHWNWFADTAPNQNDKPLQDYGVQTVPSYRCALWRAFRDASREYRAATGERAPFGEIVVRAGAPNAGTPWTNYDTIWWPANHRLMSSGASVPQHEYAHAFRHVFDGSAAHFFLDVGRFRYPQHHDGTSCAPTNEGFAFNEGWAEFWSGMVLTPCPNGADYRVERNVSAALAKVQRDCRYDRGQMVAILRANRGRIHSFGEFRAAAGACATAATAAQRVVGSALTVSQARMVAEQARAGRDWLRALAREQRRLQGVLVKVARRPAVPAGCRPRPCVAQIARTVELELVRAQIAQLRDARRRLAFAADARVLRRAGGRSGTAINRALERAGRRVQRSSALIAARGLTAAQRAVRRLPGARRSTRAASVARMLGRARSRAARGNVAALQALAVTAPGLLEPGPPAPAAPPPAPPPFAPPPPPPPSGDLRAASTLTMDSGCGDVGIWFPAADSGGSLPRRGQLVPAVAGSVVRITYRREDIATGAHIDTIEHSATTDAQGTFTDVVTSDEYASGYARRWRVQAHFDGDAQRLPVRSCEHTMRAHYP